MKIILSIVSILFLISCGGDPSSTERQRIAVLGDSITFRTGLCLPTDTLESCTAAKRNQPENSYATYIGDVIFNGGRSSDTCLTNAPFVGGPFNGQNRGVLARAHEVIAMGPSTISVLIGINDLNAYPNPESAVIACIESVWLQIRAANIEPIGMTYAKIPGLIGEESLNARIRESGKRLNVRIVDLETLGDQPTLDNIHPTTEAAKAFGALWVATIR